MAVCAEIDDVVFASCCAFNCAKSHACMCFSINVLHSFHVGKSFDWQQLISQTCTISKGNRVNMTCTNIASQFSTGNCNTLSAAKCLSVTSYRFLKEFTASFAAGGHGSSCKRICTISHLSSYLLLSNYQVLL